MTTPDDDLERSDTPLTTDPDQQTEDDTMPDDPNTGEGGAG